MEIHKYLKISTYIILVIESNIRKKLLLVPSITEDFVDAMGFQLHTRELN